MKSNVGSTATPGQVHSAYLQMNKAFNQMGVDPFETMRKLIKGNFFEKSVISYLKENGHAIVSDKFESADFKVSTMPTGKTYTIGTDRKSLIGTKEEGGLFDWVDPDIAKWFPDVVFTDNEETSGQVQLFKNNMKHREIIAEGESLGIYEEYELGYALFLVNELVKAGAIEKKGYGVIIYLKNRKNDNRYRLFVYRRDGGGLEVRINKVGPVYEWHAGDGVLFSN
jgi:hypothetical protein